MAPPRERRAPVRASHRPPAPSRTLPPPEGIAWAVPKVERKANAHCALMLHPATHGRAIAAPLRPRSHRCASTGTIVRALTLDFRMSTARGAPRHCNGREPSEHVPAEQDKQGGYL